MPELPEVETSCRGVAPHIVGRKLKQVIVRNGRLRWPVDSDLANILEGRKLLELSRRGKYMLFRFSHGHLLMHLGMSGSVRIVNAAEEPQKHDHVDFLFSLDSVLRFTDPRRFGAIVWTTKDPGEHQLIHHLGPEPLSDEFSAPYLYQKTRKSKKAIKVLIMESKIVVGVGNIYANESLFMTGIRPGRAACRITKAEAESLVSNIKTVLTKAIAQGGTTLKDFVGGDGKPGYFKQELNVYGRDGEPCLKCATLLKGQRHSQRASVYCPSCQK